MNTLLYETINTVQLLERHLTRQVAEVSLTDSEGMEAWVRAGHCSAGIFVEEGGVRIVIWVGNSPRVFEPGRVNLEFRSWAREALREQITGASGPPPADPPKRWPPTVNDVLSRLRNGARYQTGGGLYYSVYYCKDSVLVRSVFDEGDMTEERVDHQTLAADIARKPECFI